MQDLVDLLAERHGMDKKDADGFVKEFFLLIKQALESDRSVKIKGLGTFKLVDVESRESVHVNTGERFQIEGHTKISFTPDTALRDIVNKPFAHFETVVLNENTVLEDILVEEQEEESDEVVESAPNESDATIIVEEPLQIVEEPLQIVDEPLQEEAIAPAVEELPTTIVAETVETSAPEVAEVVEPQFSTEEIIANELQKAEREFGTPQKATQQKEKEGKSAVPYLVAIIVFVLLLCGSALFFIYYPDLFSSDGQNEVVQRTNPQPIVEQPVPQQEERFDTLAAVKDTVAEVVPEVKKVMPDKPLTEVSAPAKDNTKKSAAATLPVKPDSVSYKISGTKTTHTVKEGETLTRVSLRFYGTKDLWPYIVQHNRDIIKNPDNVPYGTILRIPELVKR